MRHSLLVWPEGKSEFYQIKCCLVYSSNYSTQHCPLRCGYKYTPHTRILPVHTQTAERENDNEMKPDKPDATHWDQYYLVITSL